MEEHVDFLLSRGILCSSLWSQVQHEQSAELWLWLKAGGSICINSEPQTHRRRCQTVFLKEWEVREATEPAEAPRVRTGGSRAGETTLDLVINWSIEALSKPTSFLHTFYSYHWVISCRSRASSCHVLAFTVLCVLNFLEVPARSLGKM